jgi:hypothetical protein
VPAPTVIVLIRFFKDFSKKIPSFKCKKPIFKCTAFEDNNGAIALATAEKLRPRAKHINLKYHHFKYHVTKGKITIAKIDTEKQLADIGTKPLERKPFEFLRKALIGWSAKWPVFFSPGSFAYYFARIWIRCSGVRN